MMGDDGEVHAIPRIRVVVRKRPLNPNEVARKEVDILSVDSEDTLTVHEPKTKVDMTKYDTMTACYDCFCGRPDRLMCSSCWSCVL